MITATRRTERELPKVDPHLALFRDWLGGEGKSKATIEHYVGASLDYMEWARRSGRQTEPGLITKVDVMLWLGEMWARVRRGEFREASVKNRFVGFRRFIRWMIDEDFLPAGHADPFKKIPLPKVPEVEKTILTPEEVSAMLGALDRAKRYRDAALVSMLYDTGLRAEELLTLKWSDFRDRSYRRAVVGNASDRRTKGRTLREILLGIDTASRLIRLRRILPEDQTWVFPSRSGEAMNTSSAHKLVKTIARNAGIERTVGLHVFRHTWACNMLRAGVTPQDLKNLGGWSDLSMVEHYTRMVEREVALDRAAPLSPVDMLRPQRQESRR